MVKHLPTSAGDLGDLGSTPRLGRPPGVEKWLLTAVFWPGTSQGQRSLVCYSPLSHRESDMTENSTVQPLYLANKEYGLNRIRVGREDTETYWRRRVLSQVLKEVILMDG